MYSKVVIPLDGSELAEGVLPYVAELIQNRGSQVHLLSVAPTMTPTAWPIMDLLRGKEERQRIKEELEHYLRTAAKRLEPIAADVQISVRLGQPTDEILSFVGAVGADLIATSTHGRSGISRWVFGSVTNRVLRGARCPVLLVRPGSAMPQPAYRRILIPLDGSELAEQVLPYVKALVRPRQTSVREDGGRVGTRIFILSVLTTGLGDRTVTLLTSYPPGLQLATTALHHAEIELRSYLRSVAATLREEGATVHIAVQQGSPAEEILAYAAEVEADLISMTTHGARGTGRWVYGNVAGRVLEGAQSPMLLVRPRSDQGGNET